MASKLTELFVDITGRTSKLHAALDTVKGQLSTWAIAKGTMTGNMLYDAMGASLRAVTGTMHSAVQQASDLNEAINRLSVVAGRYGQPVADLADEMAKKFGVAKQEIIEAGAGFIQMFQGAGIGNKQAGEMAAALARMAADAGSQQNKSVPEVLGKMKSALTGANEPLREMGVLISEDMVAMQAMSMGFRKIGGDFTEAAKMQARYALIMDRLKPSKGDRGNTQFEYANANREMWGRISNIITDIGQAALPGVKTALHAINELLTRLEAGTGGIKDLVGDWSKKIGDFIAILSTLDTHFGDVTTIIKDKLAGVWEDTKTIAMNTFVGLAKFLEDLFLQVGGRIAAGLREKIGGAFPAAMATFLGPAGVLLANGGQGGPAPDLKPNFGLLGDPMAGVGQHAPSREAQDAMDRVRKTLKEKGIGQEGGGDAELSGEGTAPAEQMRKPGRLGTTDLAGFYNKLQEGALGNSQIGLQKQANQIANQQVTQQQQMLAALNRIGAKLGEGIYGLVAPS